MGDFDFGQFKEIFDYLIDKLNDGDALTPQEQQVYDMLIGFSNQGLNLTNTADFNSLYTAFNALADEGTKAEFERLYGSNFTQGPDGQINFTNPGTIIEQFMRRGQSVNDGPAMAALSDGLKNYLKQIAQNKFAAMTNSYAAMTPIRAQNIQAATNAGNVASTAIGRRVPIGGVAMSGARAGAGAGEGEMPPEGIAIDTRGAGAAGDDEPGFLDKFGPALLGLLGTGALGIGGYLLKDWWNKKPAEQDQGDDIDLSAEKRPPGWQDSIEQQPADYMGSLRMADAYNYPVADMNTQMPGGDQPMYGYPDITMNPYGDMGGTYGGGSWQQDQYYDIPTPSYGGGGDGGSWQDTYSYDSYSEPSWDQSWQDTGYWDGGASYDPNSWSGDYSSGYWV